MTLIWNNPPIAIDIDPLKVIEDQADRPVLLALTGSSGQNGYDFSKVFNHLESVDNRKKIAVTLDDRETQCYVEIAEWDQVNKQAWLWIKVPSVSGTEITRLYFYYDKSQANNTTYVGDTGEPAAQAVWSNNYEGVWHMKNSNGQVLDSTANANHGTIYGATVTQGPLGACLSFDGADDRVIVPNHTALNPSTGNYTFGLVCKIRAGATASGHSYWMCPIEKRAVGPGGYYVGFESNTLGWRFMLNAPPRTDTLPNPDTLYTGAFVDVRATIDRSANTQSILVSNLDTGTIHDPQITTPPEGQIVDNGPLYIGGISAFPFDGQIYMVQLERCVRSPAWIATTNAALSDELIIYSDTPPITFVNPWILTTHATLTDDLLSYTELIPPVAAFSLALNGRTLACTDQSIGEGITGWLWDFDDGAFSTEQNPIHVYENLGNYTVTLTLTWEFGILEPSDGGYDPLPITQPGLRIAVEGDTDTALPAHDPPEGGGAYPISPVDKQTHVWINDRRVVVVGEDFPVHCGTGAAGASSGGSSHVYINGIPVCREGDVSTAPHTMTGITVTNNDHVFDCSKGD